MAGRSNGRPAHPHSSCRCAPGYTLSDRAVGLLFIAPFVTAALFFMVYPIVEAVRMAFYSYNPLRPDLSAFVGLANFEFIFRDPLFWDSFRQATVWTFLSIVFQTVFGVGHRAAAASGAARHRRVPRPAAVSLHRADGGDRADLALDLQSGDRRGELRAAERGADQGADLLALHAQHGDGLDHHAQRVEIHAVRGHLRAGAPADGAARALRRRQGRRRGRSCAGSSTSPCRSSRRC